MKQVIFDGVPCNLSRFGWVTPGQVLNLTDDEARDVVADPRFKSVRKPEVSPEETKNLKILEVQQLSMEQARARIAELQKVGKAIDVKRGATHSQLQVAILRAEGLTD
jgi:hypothetical protein